MFKALLCRMIGHRQCTGVTDIQGRASNVRLEFTDYTLWLFTIAVALFLLSMGLCNPRKSELGMKAILALIAVAFIGIRVYLVGYEVSERFEDFFKDLAHVYVGGLFGAALVCEEPFGWVTDLFHPRRYQAVPNDIFYSFWAWTLTVVEVLCAIATKVFA